MALSPQNLMNTMQGRGHPTQPRPHGSSAMGSGWAQDGENMCCKQPARHQHMLRSPEGNTGTMTSFLWINQPAEMLECCEAPKHPPGSLWAPPCAPDHPWQSSGCLWDQQKGDHGCSNRRSDPFVHHLPQELHQCYFWHALHSKRQHMEPPPWHRGKYWSLLWQNVTKSLQMTARAGRSLFLCSRDTEASQLQLENLIFCSSCGKAIEQMIIRESEGVQNRAWFKECLWNKKVKQVIWKA